MKRFIIILSTFIFIFSISLTVFAAVPNDPVKAINLDEYLISETNVDGGKQVSIALPNNLTTARIGTKLDHDITDYWWEVHHIRDYDMEGITSIFANYYPFSTGGRIPVSYFDLTRPLTIDPRFNFYDPLNDEYIPSMVINHRCYLVCFNDQGLGIGKVSLPKTSQGYYRYLLSNLPTGTVSITFEFYVQFSLQYAFDNGLDSVYIGFQPEKPWFSCYKSTVRPVIPNNSGSISDVNNVENNLMSGVGDAHDQIGSLQSNAFSFFTNMTAPFMFASALIVDTLNSLGPVNDLFYVALAIGILAALLGIVGVGISKNSKNSNKKKGGHP